MQHMAIVIAEEEGGLYAAIDGTGYIIVEVTKQKFASLVTYSDVPCQRFGNISTEGDVEGWIACAVYSE
jgi:hypothetical protein